MTSNAYQVVDAYRTVETFGGLDSRDVQRVTVQALPSGVAFGVQFTASPQAFNSPDLLAIATDDIAKPYAGYVDDAFNTPGVIGIYGYSDFTPSGTQQDFWVVTFASDNGVATSTRTLDFIDIRPERFPAIVEQTVASLNALAASGA